MDIVVTGRNCEITDRYRTHVGEKLSRLEKHDHRLMRMHVEVDCEPNPRQQKEAVKIELTAYSKGPVVRAEAAAEDKMGALDLALDKMAAQMRRASDRRRSHRGRGGAVPAGVNVEAGASEVEGSDSDVHFVGPIAVQGDGPLVVREKLHEAVPMTLDEALYEMELVGHDFFLFVEKETARPSVVYRRKGYDYGVIGLDLTP